MNEHRGGGYLDINIGKTSSKLFMIFLVLDFFFVYFESSTCSNRTNAFLILLDIYLTFTTNQLILIPIIIFTEICGIFLPPLVSSKRVILGKFQGSFLIF